MYKILIPARLNSQRVKRKLLEKQKIMYARLSLSDDPEAKELLSTLKSSVALMGFPPNMDMNSFFDNVYKTVQTLRLSIDK